MQEIFAEYEWLLPLITTTLTVIFVLVLSFFATRISDAVVRRLFDRLASERLGEHQRRLKTLGAILGSVLRYTIYFIAITTVLRRMGVETSSILAAAGIVGLAVGFGAQNLVKDVIAGFFIILEDQFGVGDYITAAGVSGIVEEVGLRVTKLRDFGGQLHIIPNGSLDLTTNHSRGPMRAMITIDVAYEENLEHVLTVLEGAMAELAGEQAELISEGPKVLGVTNLGNHGVSILLWARAVSMSQWALEREMRKKVKLVFDREGIEIPYNRTVLVPPGATKITSPLQVHVNAVEQALGPFDAGKEGKA